MNFEKIKYDNLSGANELLHKSFIILNEFWQTTDRSSPDFEKQLKQIGLKLISSQPRMAPIFNLVNYVLNQYEKDKNDLRAIEAFMQRIINAENKSTTNACEILTNKKRICTYSRSSLVIKVLGELQNKSYREIFLTESRPVNEGQKAADQLLAMGYKVTFMVDAAMRYAVEQCEIVLVGCDAFSEKYFINKIGTYPLALLARELGKPIYAFSQNIKFLPSSVNLFLEEQHNENEVWSQANSVKIYNKYFEDIPVDLLTGIVTEDGILSPQKLSHLEKQYQLNRILSAKF